MDKKWKKKAKRRWRGHGSANSVTSTGTNSDSSDMQGSVPAEGSGSSAAVVTRAASAATTSSLQFDSDRTHSHAKQSQFHSKRKGHKYEEPWGQTGMSGEQNRNQKGTWREDCNRNNGLCRNSGVNFQGSLQREGQSAEDTQRRWGHCNRNSFHGNHSYTGEAIRQEGHTAENSGSGHKHDCPHDVTGISAGSSKRKRGTRGGSSKRNYGYDALSASTSGTSGDTASSSSSLEIPGFYYDPEKKQYFKIMSSNHVPKGDTHFITKESIQKKETEARRQKDLTVFASGSKDMSTSSSATRHVSRPPYHSSLSSMLIRGYQRGDVNRRVLERAWNLNSVQQLKQTNTQCVTHSILDDHHPEHMVMMDVNKEHDQLLCLWSLVGTTKQKIKLVDVQATRPPSKKLSVQFKPVSRGGDVTSWTIVTSMSWANFPQHPDKKFVLYSNMCPTGQLSTLVFIRCLEEETPAGFENLSFNLGKQMVWTCAWNYHRHQLGLGATKSCVVIDAVTRQMKLYTMKTDAISLVFSKADGNMMYTGLRSGSILQYDLRNRTTYPVNPDTMKHPISVCCVRLSPEETYLYSSDFCGSLQKWDLRMRKVVLTYEGLCNRYCYLPFHIDETQSVLYAAGQDCYTKLWCVRTGKPLLTIPPPYEADLHSIPALSFANDWGRMPGNSGLIMAARDNFFLYSLQDWED